MERNDLDAISRRLRLTMLETVAASKKGHIGGALSCLDILVALYHGNGLRHDPAAPAWEGRDRFILSKGHASVALFAVLADRGFFPADEYAAYCRDGSRLGGHPDRRVPGVDADSGSLGHGPGLGAGMALAARRDNKDHLVCVLLGDGECYEGSVWEAFNFAAHHRLGNLVVIIDRNNQCVLDRTEDCNRLEPLDDKLRAFGLEVIETNGHDHAEILAALERARTPGRDRPLAVIARTVKGRGISFMENTLKWHHGIPTAGELAVARRELGGEQGD